jgi:hypothetical protein
MESPLSEAGGVNIVEKLETELCPAGEFTKQSHPRGWASGAYMRGSMTTGDTL